MKNVLNYLFSHTNNKQRIYFPKSKSVQHLTLTVGKLAAKLSENLNLPLTDLSLFFSGMIETTQEMIMFVPKSKKYHFFIR